MGLGKQAKILSDAQQRAVLSYIKFRSYPARNTVMFLLSVDAGLRAKEIASLMWPMILNADGSLADTIMLQNKAAKGNSGGIVYMSKRLRAAMRVHYESQQRTGSVIKSRNGSAMSAQVVTNWFFDTYRRLGFEGCSSHSGRRTAITRWARSISSVGGSLRDVQALARHSSLQMTQRYIDVSEDACRRVVG